MEYGTRAERLVACLVADASEQKLFQFVPQSWWCGREGTCSKHRGGMTDDLIASWDSAE
jgi:hypothetical protein